MRLLDDNGRPSGPERRLTETPDASYEASLERLGDVFAVAWYEQTSDGRQTAMLGDGIATAVRSGCRRLLPRRGTPSSSLTGRPSSRPGFRLNPIPLSGCTWAPGIGTARESRTRTRVGAASKKTWNLNIAVDRSGAWIVYDAATSTRASELFLARVDGSGAHLERLTKDDGAESKYPDLKIGDEGRVALTWYDMRDGNDEVYLFVGSQSDLHGEIDDRSRRVTMTDGRVDWRLPRLERGRDRARVVGQDAAACTRSFSSDSTAPGCPSTPRQRITRSTMWSLVPAIRPWRTGFALAWTEYQPTSSQMHEGTGEVAFALVD